jgi:ribonuclease E
MAKKMLIDATHTEETRVVVVDGNKVEEFDFETVNKRQLAGNIYLAKVTRVEPSLQAAFVEYGGNRHGFLAFAEIHPDYYQIPVADRKALIEEERAMARAEEEEDNRRSRRRAPRPQGRAEKVKVDDAVAEGPSGMDVVDLGEDEDHVEATPVVEHEHSHDHDHEHDHSHDAEAANGNGNGEQAYRAMDHASETDDEIESIAEEDVAEEIAAPRRPRARRYKIQEVVKVRQIMLVQVVKEERGNKGAALTTYLSLAGRYCVLMPNTARGGGISRKITQAADRKKLKEIAQEIEVPEGAGLIIRTAGAKRTKPEIKRDYEYLMRLWEQIRELTLKSIAPAKIYEEGDLIKRTIRDLYSREIEEILVEGEGGYRTAKDFMRMIMPSHAKQVIRYTEPTPLFAKYQVEGYLAGMFNPVVQLKSGGYIVIGVTEALVAIDVNSGRATKEGSIEDTAFKTNLEAADEVARQLRLRDLAGLIVIDFIDMEERKNNLSVEKRLKDKLKTDRARIQVGRISGLWSSGNEPAAVAAGDAGIDDAGLPALPRHRADPQRRQHGLAGPARAGGRGHAEAVERGAAEGSGRDRELPDQPEARAYCADRGALRDERADRGGSDAGQPRLLDGEAEDRAAGGAGYSGRVGPCGPDGCACCRGRG